MRGYCHGQRDILEHFEQDQLGLRLVSMTYKHLSLGLPLRTKSHWSCHPCQVKFKSEMEETDGGFDLFRSLLRHYGSVFPSESFSRILAEPRRLLCVDCRAILPCGRCTRSQRSDVLTQEVSKSLNLPVQQRQLGVNARILKGYRGAEAYGIDPGQPGEIKGLCRRDYGIPVMTRKAMIMRWELGEARGRWDVRCSSSVSV